MFVKQNSFYGCLEWNTLFKYYSFFKTPAQNESKRWKKKKFDV